MSNSKTKKSGGILREIAQNKKLIFNLSKNDFKAKFAGSYFGIIWAFIQPIITILVYWFVFDKALNAGTQITKAGIMCHMSYGLWQVWCHGFIFRR